MYRNWLLSGVFSAFNRLQDQIEYPADKRQERNFRLCIKLCIQLATIMTGNCSSCIIMETVWYKCNCCRFSISYGCLNWWLHTPYSWAHLGAWINISFSGKTQLVKECEQWQKAPFQFMLGLIYHFYCVLWLLGLWLELNINWICAAMKSPHLILIHCFVMTPFGLQREGKRQSQWFNHIWLDVQKMWLSQWKEEFKEIIDVEKAHNMEVCMYMCSVTCWYPQWWKRH